MKNSKLFILSIVSIISLSFSQVHGMLRRFSAGAIARPAALAVAVAVRPVQVSFMRHCGTGKIDLLQKKADQTDQKAINFLELMENGGLDRLVENTKKSLNCLENVLAQSNLYQKQTVETFFSNAVTNVRTDVNCYNIAQDFVNDDIKMDILFKSMSKDELKSFFDTYNTYEEVMDFCNSAADIHDEINALSKDKEIGSKLAFSKAYHEQCKTKEGALAIQQKLNSDAPFHHYVWKNNKKKDVLKIYLSK